MCVRLHLHYTIDVLHFFQTLLNTVGGSYAKLAEECVKAGVGVDLFLFPTTGYTDIATLGKLASSTGGELHFFPNFQVIYASIYCNLLHTLLLSFFLSVSLSLSSLDSC